MGILDGSNCIQMIRVKYERYCSDDNKTSGEWKVVSKDFPNSEEADRFIFRIKGNIIVRLIWKTSI